MPWESLRVPQWENEKPARIRDAYLGLNPVLSLLRHPLGAATRPELSCPGRLRFLLLYANPEPGRHQDYQYAEYLPAARQAILESLKPLEEQGLVEVIVPRTGAGGMTPDEALAAIAKHNPHVVIVLAHGSNGWHGGFWFTDGQGGLSCLEGQRLAEALGGRAVRLVFAPVCFSASLAPALAAVGVPVLVGINAATPFPDTHDVERFSRGFFADLAARLPLEECMNRGREMLSRNPGIERAEWVLPTLYLTAPNGRLFGSEEELLREAYLERVESACNHFPAELFNPHNKVWTVSKNYIQTTVKEEK